jgi:hypothetical protein
MEGLFLEVGNYFKQDFGESGYFDLKEVLFLILADVARHVSAHELANRSDVNGMFGTRQSIWSGGW